MTCYFRWMRDTFKKADIEVTDENKKEIDETIHAIVEVEYKDCSQTWKKVKQQLADDEKLFIQKLKGKLS